MTRKTRLVTLGILAAVAAIGAGSCCVNWYDDPQQDGVVGGDHGGGHSHTSRRWVPILFFGGGWSRTPVPIHAGPSSPAPGTAPTHPGSSSTPRGGFGSTAAHGSGVGA